MINKEYERKFMLAGNAKFSLDYEGYSFNVFNYYIFKNKKSPVRRYKVCNADGSIYYGIYDEKKNKFEYNNNCENITPAVIIASVLIGETILNYKIINLTNKCAYCGKEITDTDKEEYGLGPKCRQKIKLLKI